jgi:L-threonylcarbamoyladenylate synthase
MEYRSLRVNTKRNHPDSRRARIYRGTPRNLARLAGVLRHGGLVAVPTETVYGLAANALDAAACRRIFRAKGRPGDDPLIVHVHDWKQVERIAEPNEAAAALAKAFWPGPLTLVLPKRDVIPDVVSSGLPTVAVRMPRHRLFRRLLQRTGLPLAAPSANPFGYISPTSAAHVVAGLGDRIGHILDGGACAIGLESTIVDLRDPRRPRVLRPGAITREQLAGVLRRRVEVAHGTANRTKAQLAPGRLARHYSPRTPSVLHGRLALSDAAQGGPDEAWLFIAKPAGARAGGNVHWLDGSGDLRRAARCLFDVLRRLDRAGYAQLHFERANGGGLADAINDRLARAAGRGR